MKRISAALLSLLILTVSAFAQSSTGRLVGTVSGPDGVIPGATVVIKDNKTGRERTILTNGEGAFVLPQLEVGAYSLKVSATGFKTNNVEGLVINVGQEYSINVALEVGNISENVTITAGADVINSTSAEVSTNVGERQLVELPLNGRNPLNLVLLQAGTASNPNQNTSINGLRTSTTNITRDGINIQDNFIRSNATDFAPGRPSVDDVAEFTITTQAGADRGFGGPQIELVTPRGQNEFHGRLFEFNRNSRLAANNFFNNATGTFGPSDALVVAGVRRAGEQRTPRPFRNRNQYGGNISGPIFKNKVFFFGYYEGLRDRLSANKLTTTFLPGASAGNFTYNRADNNALQTVNLLNIPLTNVTTTPFPTGLGSVNSVVASRFFSNLPIGNTPEAGDGRNTTGYRFTQASNQDRDSYTTRFDYDINERNSINGVYNRVSENNLRSDIDGSFNTTPTVVQPSTTNFLALAYRVSPTNSITNELRGGFFKSSPVFLRTQDQANFFTIPAITNREVNFRNQGRAVRTTNLQDNADYLKGNHSLRFGGQFQNVQIDAFNDVANLPTYTLGINVNTPQITVAQFTNTALFPGGVPAAQRAGANNLIGLFGGFVTAASQTFNVTSQDSGFVPGATQRRIFNYSSYAFYVTDQWRVSPTLTFNYGLRYDLYTALRSENGLALEPALGGRPVREAILDPNGSYQFIGGNARGSRFYRSDRNNFAPVISFAWQPRSEGGIKRFLFGDGKTVLRGGYRMSYVNDELVRAPDNALSGNQGLALSTNAINPLTNTVALNARINALPAITVPAFTANRTYAQNNAAAGLFGTVFAVDPNVQIPRVNEYNFSIQRDLGANMALEARYVGNYSKNLLRGIDLNQVDIISNGFLADFNRARSNFLLTGNAGCTSAGCQPLTVFPNLGGGGLVTNAAVTTNFVNGTPADLAILYITNGLAGNVRFLANPNAGVVDLLLNGARSNYNSLQVELRRRFASGFYFQANYTFQKSLTNGQGTGQTRFEPLLDNGRPELEYARADFDQTQVFNFNSIYELPFGKSKRFLNSGAWLNRLVGGWQLTSIWRFGTGSPITFTDARGTFNRAARSGRQTPNVTINNQGLQNLTGVFRTPTGIFFVNPSAVNPATGRGAEVGQTTPFNGQQFFNVAPGQVGNLGRAAINGPSTFNVDASVIKNIAITERLRFQIRGEAFNLMNHTNFVPAQFYDINSATFGRITSTFAPRVVQVAGRIEF
jgi:hypothetical protein